MGERRAGAVHARCSARSTQRRDPIGETRSPTRRAAGDSHDVEHGPVDRDACATWPRARSSRRADRADEIKETAVDLGLFNDIWKMHGIAVARDSGGRSGCRCSQRGTRDRVAPTGFRPAVRGPRSSRARRRVDRARPRSRGRDGARRDPAPSTSSRAWLRGIALRGAWSACARVEQQRRSDRGCRGPPPRGARSRPADAAASGVSWTRSRCSGVCAADGAESAEAVRLLAAADAVRRAAGTCYRTPTEQAAYDATLAMPCARRMGAAFEVAWSEGIALR